MRVRRRTAGTRGENSVRVMVILRRQDGRPGMRQVELEVPKETDSQFIVGPCGLVWDRFSAKTWYADDIVEFGSL